MDSKDYGERLRRAAVGLKVDWLAEAGDEFDRLKRQLDEAKDLLVVAYKRLQDDRKPKDCDSSLPSDAGDAEGVKEGSKDLPSVAADPWGRRRS
jgi:hypothetical protein